MHVQLGGTRLGGGHSGQPLVELLVERPVRVRMGQQVGPPDLTKVVGQPAGGQLIAEGSPPLRGHDEEIIPGPARDRPVDGVWLRQAAEARRWRRRPGRPGRSGHMRHPGIGHPELDAAELDLVAGLQAPGLAGEQSLAVDERAARRVQVANDEFVALRLEHGLPRGHPSR